MSQRNAKHSHIGRIIRVCDQLSTLDAVFGIIGMRVVICNEDTNNDDRARSRSRIVDATVKLPLGWMICPHNTEPTIYTLCDSSGVGHMQLVHCSANDDPNQMVFSFSGILAPVVSTS